MAARIDELVRRIPGISLRFQELTSGRNGPLGMGNIFVDPELIARSYIAPKGRAARSIDQPDDRLTVDSGGDRLTESKIAKPRLLPATSSSFFPLRSFRLKNRKL